MNISVYTFLVIKRLRNISESREIYVAGFKFILIYEDQKFLLYFSKLSFEKYLALRSLFDEYAEANLPHCFLISLISDNKNLENEKDKEEIVKTISLFIKNELYPLERRNFDYKEVEESVKAYVALYKKVKKALLEGFLLLAKQPIVDKNKKVCGFELLSRLYDKESQTLIYPKDYLFVLKRAKDLVYDFEDQVLEKGIKFLMESRDPDLFYHINFSPLYLSDNFRHIEKELSQKDLKKRLTIEITENFSDATRKEDDLIELSHILSSKGIKVVLDDFGEGGSNISLILKSSFCGLKLSPSLIKEYVKMFNSQSFDYSQKKRVIVSSLIKLVRDLSRYNMAKVYIEGIEKEEDFFRCKQIIDPSYFQGLYFGKPDLITLNL